MNKKPELPQLLNTWNRPINSSKFLFTAEMFLWSYVPKKCKNVVLMSTLHRDGRICGQEHQKQEIIIDYNATKGGQFRKAGDWIQLQKKNTMLAT